MVEPERTARKEITQWVILARGQPVCKPRRRLQDKKKPPEGGFNNGGAGGS